MHSEKQTKLKSKIMKLIETIRKTQAGGLKDWKLAVVTSKGATIHSWRIYQISETRARAIFAGYIETHHFPVNVKFSLQEM